MHRISKYKSPYIIAWGCGETEVSTKSSNRQYQSPARTDHCPQGRWHRAATSPLHAGSCPVPVIQRAAPEADPTLHAGWAPSAPGRSSAHAPLTFRVSRLLISLFSSCSSCSFRAEKNIEEAFDLVSVARRCIVWSSAAFSARPSWRGKGKRGNSKPPDRASLLWVRTCPSPLAQRDRQTDLSSVFCQTRVFFLVSRRVVWAERCWLRQAGRDLKKGHQSLWPGHLGEQ